MTDAPVARRRNHGRGHSYEIDGARVPGVTTILDNGIPKPALIDWAARTTAAYAVDHWNELDQEPASTRLRTLEQARWETSRSAMARGTTIHEYAVKLAAGQEVQVPDEITGFVDSYLQFVEDWQPSELLVEVPVFNRSARYAGTLDLVADLADGNTWLLDWKTGGKGIFPESALQLAAYRHAEFYVDNSGQERELPDIDLCGCVWLRQDGYDLHPVNGSDRTFRIFRYAQQVASFVQHAKDDRELYVCESLPVPA